MRCAHCKINVKRDSHGQAMHVEPGDAPYLHCRYAKAEVDVSGTWLGRFNPAGNAGAAIIERC